MPKLSFVVFHPPGYAQPCLVPSTAFDQQPFRSMRLRHGDVFTADFHKPRSGKHHRKCMLLLRMIFESQERFDHVEALRRFLTMQTSFVIETIDHANGEVIRIPRSWAFGEMDQTEFDQLYLELGDAAIRCFYPTEDANWLKASVNYQAFIDSVLAFS